MANGIWFDLMGYIEILNHKFEVKNVSFLLFEFCVWINICKKLETEQICSSERGGKKRELVWASVVQSMALMQHASNMIARII